MEIKTLYKEGDSKNSFVHFIFFVVKKFVILILVSGAFAKFFFPSAYSQDAWERITKTGELRWGADSSGGAPYIFPDDKDPTKLIGFEVDIMDALCRKLGVKSKVVQIQWDQLVPALLRNDFDIAFNGLEITSERLEVIDFTIPYYFFSQQITVRSRDNRIKEFKDLQGKRVGTLSASLAQKMMEDYGYITVVPYPSSVEVYRDLEIGRIDASLQDVPIAAWYVTPNPALKNVGEPVGEGVYAGGIRKNSPILKEKINEALTQLINSGGLEQIYRKWNMGTKNQDKLKEFVKENIVIQQKSAVFSKYIPLLLKGAVVTIIISFLSMILAVGFGFVLCIGRLYGNRWIKISSRIYVEVIRGTPLLIQLYLLYYGLPNIGIKLSAPFAAILGMGLNYAAYEAEIYRAGLLSVPHGQEEAGRALGMSGRQTLRYIILPQAIRTILPPSTNDFIALFKDTSLVSIITVTELTRAYIQAANTTYRFLELGLITALLYFLMGFPLSLWANKMEKRRHVIMH